MYIKLSIEHSIMCDSRINLNYMKLIFFCSQGSDVMKQIGKKNAEKLISEPCVYSKNYDGQLVVNKSYSVPYFN